MNHACQAEQNECVLKLSEGAVSSPWAQLRAKNSGDMTTDKTWALVLSDDPRRD